MDLDIEDHAQLLAYLREHGHSDLSDAPRMHTLAGGVSNRTVLVEFAGGKGWVVKQALAKLRTKADWFSDPARVHREALGIRWLQKLAPAGTIPGFVFEDMELHLLGMEAVPQPHENWKTLLLNGQVQTDHVRQFGQLLGAIHRHAAESDEGLPALFDDRTFFETLRLEPYYAYAATQAAEAGDFLNDLIGRTRSRRLTIVHGDYSPKNVLVHHDRLVLLDHEVIHWGDPTFDLGFALTHFLGKLNHVKLPAFADAAGEFFATYRSAVGDGPWTKDVEPMAVRQTLGCLLARVAGRSPLEYLMEEERSTQRRIVIQMMQRPPERIDELVARFAEGIV
jgi:tRNA A-37 threonylcarbamoyl transferase component Bud32